VKHKKVLERVYNPGRLRMAWQQVRKNAGAAGIDRRAVRFVMNLKWFRKQGLVFLNDFTKRPLELSLFNR
jgi:hypothetical protein